MCGLLHDENLLFSDIVVSLNLIYTICAVKNIVKSLIIAIFIWFDMINSKLTIDRHRNNGLGANDC